MSNDLQLAQPTDLANLGDFLPAPTTSKVLEQLGGSGIYLPYVQLVQSASPLCNPPTSIPQGHFALKTNRNDVRDVGNEIDVFFADWRPKVMFSDRTQNIVKTCHDLDDPLFIEWREKAEDREKNYYWGYEMLLYYGTSGQYITLFCNNPTLRRAFREKLVKFLRQACLLIVKQIQDPQYSWWGIEATSLSAPFDHPVDLNVLKDMIATFKATRVEEKVDEEAPFDTERAR